MSKSLGERLKLSRSRKNLTQEEVSKLIGVKPQTISGYEKNYRQPDSVILAKLADIYNTTTDYLLGRIDSPNPPQNTDIDEYIYQANDLGQALLKIIELDHKLGFDDKTLVELVKKAKEKYGMPEVSYAEPAAHGPGYPGSGALDDEDDEDDE